MRGEEQEVRGKEQEVRGKKVEVRKKVINNIVRRTAKANGLAALSVGQRPTDGSRNR